MALLLLISLALSPQQGLGAQELDPIIDSLQKNYEDISDLSARFTQMALIKAIGKVKVRGGRAYFKKPGMMRWEYEGKPGDLIISDGKTLWMYFPEDNQVQVSRFSQAWAGRLPTAYLAGLGRLRRDFDISFASPERDERGNYILNLTPKEPLPQVSKLTVTVDKDSLFVIASSFTDPLGNRTDIRFSQIRINQGLRDSLFIFVPPPEAEVIEASPMD